MASGVQRGSDAREAVGHNRVRLTLAVRAHQQHPRSVLRTHSRARVHQSPRESFRAVQERSKATRAPTAEQTALTASLSNPTRPPAWLVAVPQLWIGCSVKVLHSSHQRRSCTVAPSRESAIAPVTPPIATATNGTGQLASMVTAPTNSAPTTAAAVPAREMPPEVPASTLLPEIMDIGQAATRVPISVAHVSAADAARAPAPIANHTCDGDIRDPSAAPANTPPLANTWPQSRSAPFSTIRRTRSAFLRSPSFESKLAEMNIERRSAPQLHPAAIEIVPTTVAAIAPLVESILIR